MNSSALFGGFSGRSGRFDGFAITTELGPGAEGGDELTGLGVTGAFGDAILAQSCRPVHEFST